jgi:uncharacterized LabA/DUF88 family protein
VDLPDPFFVTIQESGVMTANVAVFIDGGYLDKVMHLCFPGQRIDYAKLVQHIARPHELFRAYYYHCLPYRSNPPTTQESSFYASKQKFTTALSFLSRFEVRLGRLVKRGYDEDGKPGFIQKRVDCMVGVDMASLAAKGKITDVALISGDSDLVPAVEAVKKESVIVTLWHGGSPDTRPSRELFEICDERHQFTEDMIQSILR